MTYLVDDTFDNYCTAERLPQFFLSKLYFHIFRGIEKFIRYTS